MKAARALALLLALGLAGCGSTRPAAPAGGEIRGAVWSPECGIEPGVCKFVRMAGATVEGCLGDRCARTRSSADGTYRLRVPGPGRYRLHARKRAELGEYQSSARDVVVRRGQILRGVDLGRAAAASG